LMFVWFVIVPYDNAVIVKLASNTITPMIDMMLFIVLFIVLNLL